MGIFDRFPYSSTHEMNLDFMLGKATEIAESLQEVQAGLSDIDTHTAQAEQEAQSAAQAAQAASASAGQAAQHVTDAEDAADRAEAASTEAETAADRAEEALGNMTDSETVCLNAAARAEAAQEAVAESASAASSSAANASLNASQAATSAGSAANSATNSARSAQNANVSATNASLHASNAEISATNAATSATNATTSANSAGASAYSAAESKEQIDTLIESLPEDFTDLNNTVNQLSAAIADIKSLVDSITEKSKNLLPVSGKTVTFNNVTVSYTDGVVTLSGTASASGGRVNKLTDPFLITPGTYTFSRSTDGNDGVDYFIEKTEDDTVIAWISSGYSTTFTINETTSVYIGCNLIQGNTYYADILKYIQLEKGTEISEYQKPTYISAIDHVARNEIEELKNSAVNHSLVNNLDNSNQMPVVRQ